MILILCTIWWTMILLSVGAPQELLEALNKASEDRSVADWNRMDKNSLRLMATGCSLSEEGTRGDLAKRLHEYYQEQVPAASSGSASATSAHVTSASATLARGTESISGKAAREPHAEKPHRTIKFQLPVTVLSVLRQVRMGRRRNVHQAKQTTHDGKQYSDGQYFHARKYFGHQHGGSGYGTIQS